MGSAEVLSGATTLIQYQLSQLVSSMHQILQQCSSYFQHIKTSESSFSTHPPQSVVCQSSRQHDLREFKLEFRSIISVQCKPYFAAVHLFQQRNCSRSAILDFTPSIAVRESNHPTEEFLRRLNRNINSHRISINSNIHNILTNR